MTELVLVARYCKIITGRCGDSYMRGHTIILGVPDDLEAVWPFTQLSLCGSHREDRGKKACRLVGKGGPYGGVGGPGPRLLQSPTPI